MRSELAFVAALVATAALTVTSSEAHAFCRQTVVPPTEPPTPGQGCVEQGAPLFHRSQCVPYHLLSVPSTRLPVADLSNAIARAFATWTAPSTSCTPGITGVELAPVSGEPIVDFTNGQRGHNVFGVVQGPWPHAGGTDTLSLATLTFNPDTGEIYDADLEIREDLPWSVTETAPSDGYDLQSVMTHEIGHVLALAHTQHPEAAMSPTYTLGSISQRKLSSDDAAGICAIYPDRQTRRVLGDKLTAATSCDLSPSTGSSGGACGDPTITHGCGLASTIPSRDGAWLSGLGILGALAWQARRRRQRA